MSHVLGDKLNSLNIKSLEIIEPIFSSFDDSKFAALYEAVSQSNLENLSIKWPSIRAPNGRPLFSSLPLSGIQQLASSNKLKSLEIGYGYDINASPLSSILRGIPKNLQLLKVSFYN